ncbi:MAG: efflux RND transporter periplasmic adaptor subunit [Terracidiphilus sp.]|nr:efflux RND transporter periplasmic adaptor subunit [Terracidiphilus sp.]
MKYFFWFWMSVLAGLVVSGCKSDAPAAQGSVETVQARVVVAERVETQAALRATGALHAHESAVLSAQAMGRVTRVLVRAGDTVRAGQTLATIDDATLRSSADQAGAAAKAAEQQQAAAQSNADLAASTLARYRQLEAQKSVSPQEMDEVTRRAEAAQAQAAAMKAQANAMRAQQAGARTMLGYARITAPFAGVVTARMIDPGALAAPGVPLLQIDSAGPLELQTTVPESAIGGLRKGIKLAVTVDSFAGESFSGTVAEIVPAADPMTHSFQVKVALPASKALRAGLSASAAIPNGMKQAVLAPRTAIVMRGSLASAYVLDANGIALLRYVTLGEAHGDKVEVLSGLNGGDRLVDSPADRDLAGKRINDQNGARP